MQPVNDNRQLKLQPITQQISFKEPMQPLEMVSVGAESCASKRQDHRDDASGRIKRKDRQCPTINQLTRRFDPDSNNQNQEKLDQLHNIRQKQNNSEFKRKSSQSVVLFNQNAPSSDFKKSIPELIMNQKNKNTYSPVKKKQPISNTVYQGFPDINMQNDPQNQFLQVTQQEPNHKKRQNMSNSPSEQALPKSIKLVSVTQSRNSMRTSENDNDESSKNRLIKQAMETNEDIRIENVNQNTVGAGSESVRYKNRNSINSITHSRQSDGSNYNSNRNIKMMDNNENNYADNEGSKSMSSINLKSSTAGSYLKQPTKENSKMKIDFDVEGVSSCQNPQQRKDHSDAFSNIKNKQVQIMPTITYDESKPDKQGDRSFVSKHREFQQRLTPLKKSTVEPQPQPAISLKIDKIMCEDVDDSSHRMSFKQSEPPKVKVYPPPEEIYIPKKKKENLEQPVKYGLNMCFKKHHIWSSDPTQGGGELNANQPCSSQPWGVMGCPESKQENLCDYIKKNKNNMIFCRYGLDYLKSFPRADDMAIGSIKINLDYLIFQKQKQLSAENEDNIVGMSFLKTKGQFQNQQLERRQENQPGGGGGPAGASAIIAPYYKSLSDEESRKTIQFDSVFESGNLAIAIQVSDKEYNCVLQNDVNTNGHTQWFYFKVKSNFEKKTEVKFNLINLYKPKSLYQYGLKILALDVSDQPKPDKIAQIQDTEEFQKSLPIWKRCGKEILYTQNKYTNEQCPYGLFEVSFKYEFTKGQKEIYFAHSMPYTYTMLNEYLNKNVTKNKAKRANLCYSLAGNKIEYLVLTNKQKKPLDHPDNDNENSNAQSKKKFNMESSVSPTKKAGDNSPLKKNLKRENKSPNKKQPEVKQIEKQVIMFTSRVHPGETNASWMIQGLMDVFLNPKDEKEEELVNNLKDHFEIYIIPMLNVDGVINGNYRCSLAACDLNRKYHKPSKTLHPPVYYTKKLCQQLMEVDKKNFFLYLDFHGHSAKKNIFQYGNKIEQLANYRQVMHKMNQPSLFPLMVSRQFDYFKFDDCTYSMPPSKNSTARISMFHKLKIPYVFTLEASFAGASKGHLNGKHFSQGDLMNVGKYVLEAIWELKKLELNKNLLKQVTEEANLLKKDEADGGDDSDGCSSSEEEMKIPEKKPKPMDVIEETESPGLSPKKDNESPQNSLSVSRRMQSPTKNKQGGFNKSIINLKTIGTEGDGGGSLQPMQGSESPGKMNSPRKNDRRNLRGELNQPLRKSIGRNFDEAQTFQDAIGQVQGRQGENKQNKTQSPIGFSNISNLMKKGEEGKGDKFDLFKNLMKAERIDSGSDYRTISSEIQAKQQELFEQFNQEIERSFHQQQQNLDEIFRKTAKHFMEITQKQQGSMMGVGKNFMHSNMDPMSFGVNMFNYGNNKYMSGGGGGGSNSYMQGNYNNKRTNPQIQTLLQLQKLHQMQKLNQIAQMQFFRQQAELLLNQNLSQQQQLELFQQFSFYQAQIQMQNQQYQIMLNQSLHGNYMANFQKARAEFPQGQQEYNSHRQRRFTPSNIDSFASQRFTIPQQTQKMPDVGMTNNYLFNQSDWDSSNNTMNVNMDPNLSDSPQRFQKKRGMSNFQQNQNMNMQKNTRNSYGKLNKNISEKYQGRPRTKSNGVHFPDTTNVGFPQHFAEDDQNYQRNLGMDMTYQWQGQAVPDIITNERQKHFSQANYYNQTQQFTKSSYQTPSKKGGINPDILTIKRDSVKFLNENQQDQYLTAPAIKEHMTQKVSGTTKLDGQSGVKTDALTVGSQNQTTNQSAAIINSQFKDKHGNMRYSNKSLQNAQIYQSSSAHINNSQSFMDKDSRFKSERAHQTRTAKKDDHSNYQYDHIQKYNPNSSCAEDNINNQNRHIAEIQPSFPTSPRKAECNIKFFSHRESRQNKRNAQTMHQRQMSNQQPTNSGQQIQTQFVLPQPNQKQQ